MTTIDARVARERFPELVRGERAWLDVSWHDPVPNEAELYEQFAGVPKWAARPFRRSRAARALAYDYDDLLQLASVGVLRGIRTHQPGAGSSLLTWVCNSARFMLRARLTQVHDKWQRVGRAPVLVTQSSIGDEDDWESLFPAARDESARHVLPAQLAAAAIGILRQRERLREADVLEMRLVDGYTLQQCGDLLGLSRERVRQIQDAGVHRLNQLQEWTKLWKPAEDES